MIAFPQAGRRFKSLGSTDLLKTRVLPDFQRVFLDRGMKRKEKARSEFIFEKKMSLKEVLQDDRERLFETFKKLLVLLKFNKTMRKLVILIIHDHKRTLNDLRNIPKVTQ